MYELGWLTEEYYYLQKDIYSAAVHDFKEFLVENIFLLSPVVMFAEIRLGFSAEHQQLLQAINFNVIQFNF